MQQDNSDKKITGKRLFSAISHLQSLFCFHYWLFPLFVDCVDSYHIL